MEWGFDLEEFTTSYLLLRLMISIGREVALLVKDRYIEEIKKLNSFK